MTITHYRKFHNVKDVWETFWERVKPLGNKLAGVLFQTPPSFAFSQKNLTRILDMHKYLPKKLRIAFEFRHISWFIPRTIGEFDKRNWCVGGTYIRKKPGSKWMGTMPSGLHLPKTTSDFTYLRIHGGRGYRGALSKKELYNLEHKIKQQKTSKHFVMFNNTFFNKRDETCTVTPAMRIKYAAVCNAVEFSHMV